MHMTRKHETYIVALDRRDDLTSSLQPIIISVKNGCGSNCKHAAMSFFFRNSNSYVCVFYRRYHTKNCFGYWRKNNQVQEGNELLVILH